MRDQTHLVVLDNPTYADAARLPWWFARTGGDTDVYSLTLSFVNHCPAMLLICTAYVPVGLKTGTAGLAASRPQQGQEAGGTSMKKGSLDYEVAGIRSYTAGVADQVRARANPCREYAACVTVSAERRGNPSAESI